ncbi:MAG: 4-alpha-glucanotransferase [Thioalkalivibrionaceae bacterium]
MTLDGVTKPPMAPWEQRREAGVLLDARALPSSIEAHLDWLDWLAAAGFRAWQMLPPAIPDATGSPYQSISAFATDPRLTPIEWRAQRPSPEQRAEFVAQECDWLNDFALFQALHQSQDRTAWNTWPPALRNRDPSALAQAHSKLSATIDRQIDEQWAADQWRQRLRQEARDRGIALIGDLPIFVALDSADVWAHRELFKLTRDSQPEFVAGVPPDYFSATGQRWGNPHYDWAAMAADEFAWWRSRLARAGRLFDRVRIDHFRGLEAVWMIDARAETAIEGYWEKVPGHELLQRIQHDPRMPELLAEDLGVITPAVEQLRVDFNLPGMAVLQFSFDHFDDNPHKPHNVGRDRVAYTGTHDNDTTAGWFTHLDDETRNRVVERLRRGGFLGENEAEPAAIAQALWSEALNTQASTVIVPLQDLLGLGSEARTNKPGTTQGNWSWQPAPRALKQLDPALLRQRLAASRRTPCDR